MHFLWFHDVPCCPLAFCHALLISEPKDSLSKEDGMTQSFLCFTMRSSKDNEHSYVSVITTSKGKRFSG